MKPERLEGLKKREDEGCRENRMTPWSSFPLFNSELSDSGPQYRPLVFILLGQTSF